MDKPKAGSKAKPPSKAKNDKCASRHEGAKSNTKPEDRPRTICEVDGCKNLAKEGHLICKFCNRKKKEERKNMGSKQSKDAPPKCSTCVMCGKVAPRPGHSRCKPCGEKNRQDKKKLHIRLDPPSYWEHKKPKADMKAKKVDVTSTCAKAYIQALFDHSNNPDRIGRGQDVESRGWAPEKFTHTGFSVQKVTRIENQMVWSSYAQFRSNVATLKVPVQKLSLLQDVKPPSQDFKLSTECNEYWLLHGTDPKTARQIIDQGWDEKFCPFDKEKAQLGGMFGQATCFADSITKIDQYINPDQEVCCCLMSRVCLGQIYITKVGLPDARFPPNHPKNHSVVCPKGPDSELTHFSEFMVYEGHHAYPEYLIEFVRTGKQPPPDQREPPKTS